MRICDDCKQVTYNASIYVTGAIRCSSCALIFTANYKEKERMAYLSAKILSEAQHDLNKPCEWDKCQECCEHWEFDHDMCLDCGYERDPGDAIDAAMAQYEGDR